MAFTFKDKLFGTTTVIEKVTETVVTDAMDAESIAAANMNKVVLIETGWKLVHARYGDDIYHEYTNYEDPKTKKKYQLPVFLEVEPNVIEPLLGLRKNVQLGEPIASSGSGTGFVVDEDGLIMTNKHVTSSWKLVPYYFPVQQGVLLKVVNGKWQNAGIINAPKNWIPGNTKLFGREPISGTTVTAENTYMDVTFAKTSQRNRATITKESEEHDLAMIKINLGGDLEPVKFASADESIKEGQKILSMGFPGLSPDQLKITKDQSDQSNSIKTVPSPTVADGIISKVIRSSSDASLSNTKNDIYSWQGETYQMTINTGSGNSGGPVFNKEGEVIAILNSTRADYAATK
ncbi:MAG: serine protease, partial [Bacteroidota bacterium]